MGPRRGIVFLYARKQCAMTFAALRKSHFQRVSDHIGRLFDTVGIDDERLGHLLRGAGKFRRMSTPGSAASWAATYSFAIRFMPSRSGVTMQTREER